MGYYDIKRNGEERNSNCPCFSLLGKVDTTLDRDEYYVEDINGEIQRGRITDTIYIFCVMEEGKLTADMILERFANIICMIIKKIVKSHTLCV